MRWIIALTILVAFGIGDTAAFFKDVSNEARLDYKGGPKSKFGGPAVADLDSDGCPDLILGHHSNVVELYFNKCDGTFRKYDFRLKLDAHGITPIRLSARDKYMHIVICRGGNSGRSTRGPKIFRVYSNRTVKDVSDVHDTRKLNQRGRAALSVSLVRPSLTRKEQTAKFPGLLLTSASLKGSNDELAAFRSSFKGLLSRKPLKGDIFKHDMKYVAAIDASNDGTVDIVALPEARVFSVSNYFTLTESTKKVFPSLPNGEPWHGVAVVVEADFNNDGLMDVYLGRTKTGDLKWRARNPKFRNVTDVLLFGTANGKYEYASKWSGIPMDSETRGATAGDFNNDGWVDLLIIVWSGQDFLLMNNGDGTFKQQSAPWTKKAKAYGDTATAVDYDQDGRLDVIVSEGSQNGKGAGYYRIMKNVIPLPKSRSTSLSSSANSRNFLLVRVGAAKNWTATSLYAIVHVKAGKLDMWRKVGSPSVVVSVSYIELVHFGLGSERKVESVVVKWTDGSQAVMKNVAANSVIKMGAF